MVYFYSTTTSHKNELITYDLRGLVVVLKVSYKNGVVKSCSSKKWRCVGVPTVKKSSFSPLFDIEIHPLFFHISSK
jgi:hypothetical protein